MLRYRSLLTAALAVAAGSCVTVTPPAATVPPIASVVTLPASNPFAAPSTLTYEAPPFDRVNDTDYQPAIEEGIRLALAESEAIANQGAPPTFENTIVAMERSGELLTRVASVFDAVSQANTNPTLQQIEKDESPKRSALNDAIYLNDRLFQRVKSIYDRRDGPGLDSVQRYLVERYYKNFVRSGALLSEQDKSRLRALNQEESKLTSTFHNRLLAATKAGALVADDPSQLEGMSAGDIAAAAAAARDRGFTGKWVIPLQNTTQHPAQVTLKNRATRERLFMSSSYRLETQMSKTPANAVKLLTDLVPAATGRARSEVAAMQSLIDAQHGGFKLQPWDWQYYAEQVRKQQYDLDESQIKPYLELDNVLRNGVFFAANKLYGITFKERKDLPVYQPDVRVFEVFDANGKSMALFYSDYFKRDNKAGGAWMDAFVGQSGLLGKKPVVFNVANFTKPAPGQPALISITDVTTMFHEFGHALHGMFSNVTYPTLAGTNTPRDYVEFPSQFNEHWALEPTVLASYAKHYQTGAPMPQALVDKIRKARTFNQGFTTTEYLAASLLDMAWHTLPPGSAQPEVDSFEADALKRYNIAMPEIPPRYRTTYFSHVWDGGYSASYYAYMWSEVLDDDAYAWFVEHGGMTRENGQRFRDMILSRGNSMDVAQLYRNFRGRDPSVESLLIERGLKPDTKVK